MDFSLAEHRLGFLEWESCSWRPGFGAEGDLLGIPDLGARAEVETTGQKKGQTFSSKDPHLGTSLVWERIDSHQKRHVCHVCKES